jgi:hypothetical protein
LKLIAIGRRTYAHLVAAYDFGAFAEDRCSDATICLLDDGASTEALDDCRKCRLIARRVGGACARFW